VLDADLATALVAGALPALAAAPFAIAGALRPRRRRG
jgi:hypothetical protein